MNVLTSHEFDERYSDLGPWGWAQVDKRLDLIREYSHFGDTRFLGSRLWELRWKNGRRVYYAVLVDEEGKEALMLLGGNKNGQDRDITLARAILEREAS